MLISWLSLKPKKSNDVKVHVFFLQLEDWTLKKNYICIYIRVCVCVCIFRIKDKEKYLECYRNKFVDNITYLEIVEASE